MVAAVATYYPVRNHPFLHFDDSKYVTANPQVQGGLSWSTVEWAFTTYYAANWHPLTWLSHALDCEMFGPDPAGPHEVNLLLHVVNLLLLFWVLERATGMAGRSAMVAGLFALHPINVETVAWVAERKNLLSMLFLLLALAAYRWYAKQPRAGRYLLVAFLFVLGLMAKPQVITLPFLLLLWDYWPLQRMGAVPGSPATAIPRSFAFLVWEKLPLFILAAADSVVTVIAQRAGGAVRAAAEVSVSARLQNVFVSYVRYLGKMFWPSRLAPMYPHPGNSLPRSEVMAAVALLLLISALVLRWRDRRYLLVGWFWFLGTLVPMIGIITVGEQAMADRFAYIPFIGLFIAVVWTLNAWSLNDWTLNASPQVTQTSEHRIPGAWLAAAAVLIVSVLGCLTYRQLGYWRDDETLWRYTLSVTERNYMAHDNLALALAKQGRSDEAVVQFRAANALHKYPPAQILELAWYEQRVGHPREAIEECNSVLRATPDSKIQAVAWTELGQAHLQLHDYDRAAESYQNALRLSPENETALVSSGVLALRRGESGQAVTQLTHAVKIDPSAVNFLLLAQSLRQAGRPDDADLAAAEARKMSPDLSQPQIAAAQLLSVVGVMPR